MFTKIKAFLKLFKNNENSADNIQCPVCGYYCLGKGGHGCIHKPDIFIDNNGKEKT